MSYVEEARQEERARIVSKMREAYPMNQHARMGGLDRALVRKVRLRGVRPCAGACWDVGERGHQHDRMLRVSVPGTADGGVNVRIVTDPRCPSHPDMQVNARHGEGHAVWVCSACSRPLGYAGRSEHFTLMTPWPQRRRPTIRDRVFSVLDWDWLLRREESLSPTWKITRTTR